MRTKPTAALFLSLVQQLLPLSACASAALLVGCQSTARPPERLTGTSTLMMQTPVELTEENRGRVITAKAQNNGQIPTALCRELCSGAVESAGDVSGCDLLDANGALSCAAMMQVMHPAGRAYAGVSPSREDLTIAPLLRWLLKTAHLEASAVHEFDALAAELVQHAAPASLIQGALSARDDEVRHSALLRQLCIDRGAEPEPLAVVPQPPRALLDIALDNAVQGCALETWGALQATWQAQTAQDPALRAALGIIAADESRHASFSWELDRWLRTQLTAAQCRKLNQVAANATQQVRSRLAATRIQPGHAQLGLPDATQALALFDMLEAA